MPINAPAKTRESCGKVHVDADLGGIILVSVPLRCKHLFRILVGTNFFAIYARGSISHDASCDWLALLVACLPPTGPLAFR